MRSRRLSDIRRYVSRKSSPKCTFDSHISINVFQDLAAVLTHEYISESKLHLGLNLGEESTNCCNALLINLVLGVIMSHKTVIIIY
jgi:hypothetical protein